MDNPPDEPHNSLTVLCPDRELTMAIYDLVHIMGAIRIVQLAQFLKDVQADTGYGNVAVVIAEKRVQRLKIERSY